MSGPKVLRQDGQAPAQEVGLLVQFVCILAQLIYFMFVSKNSQIFATFFSRSNPSSHPLVLDTLIRFEPSLASLSPFLPPTLLTAPTLLPDHTCPLDLTLHPFLPVPHAHTLPRVPNRRDVFSIFKTFSGPNGSS